MQAHIDWGTYFLSQVFGDKNEIVLLIYNFPKKPADIAHVRAIAETEGRDLLLITRAGAAVTTDAAVVSTPGHPLTVYSFDTWMIIRYRPSHPRVR